eukprot:TRINITY_DN266_c0_g1_i2.p1 TRINITY_DN266_c0_g1~~TRINITY_DN266_c0_g1_i2.p1  ORF type:complete len:1055 (-),score=263.33 TRINITY_DN266_c0_g1_i2:29-3193(-)
MEFLGLSINCWACVLQWIPAKEVNKLCTVNRGFQRVALDNSVWSRRTHERWTSMEKLSERPTYSFSNSQGVDWKQYYEYRKKLDKVWQSVQPFLPEIIFARTLSTTDQTELLQHMQDILKVISEQHLSADPNQGIDLLTLPIEEWIQWVVSALHTQELCFVACITLEHCALSMPIDRGFEERISNALSKVFCEIVDVYENNFQMLWTTLPDVMKHGDLDPNPDLLKNPERTEICHTVDGKNVGERKLAGLGELIVSICLQLSDNYIDVLEVHQHAMMRLVDVWMNLIRLTWPTDLYNVLVINIEKEPYIAFSCFFSAATGFDETKNWFEFLWEYLLPKLTVFNLKDDWRDRRLSILGVMILSGLQNLDNKKAGKLAMLLENGLQDSNEFVVIASIVVVNIFFKQCQTKKFHGKLTELIIPHVHSSNRVITRWAFQTIYLGSLEDRDEKFREIFMKLLENAENSHHMNFYALSMMIQDTSHLPFSNCIDFHNRHLRPSKYFDRKQLWFPIRSIAGSNLRQISGFMLKVVDPQPSQIFHLVNIIMWLRKFVENPSKSLSDLIKGDWALSTISRFVWDLEVISYVIPSVKNIYEDTSRYIIKHVSARLKDCIFNFQLESVNQPEYLMTTDSRTIALLSCFPFVVKSPNIFNLEVQVENWLEIFASLFQDPFKLSKQSVAVAMTELMLLNSWNFFSTWIQVEYGKLASQIIDELFDVLMSDVGELTSCRTYCLIALKYLTTFPKFPKTVDISTSVLEKLTLFIEKVSSELTEEQLGQIWQILSSTDILPLSEDEIKNQFLVAFANIYRFWEECSPKYIASQDSDYIAIASNMAFRLISFNYIFADPKKLRDNIFWTFFSSIADFMAASGFTKSSLLSIVLVSSMVQHSRCGPGPFRSILDSLVGPMITAMTLTDPARLELRIVCLSSIGWILRKHPEAIQHRLSDLSAILSEIVETEDSFRRELTWTLINLILQLENDDAVKLIPILMRCVPLSGAWDWDELQVFEEMVERFPVEMKKYEKEVKEVLLNKDEFKVWMGCNKTVKEEQDLSQQIKSDVD